MRLFTRHVKITFLVSLRGLYVLSFSMCKDILYDSVKKFVKTRKEDLYAFFTASLRIRKFIISCCVLGLSFRDPRLNGNIYVRIIGDSKIANNAMT